MAEPTSGPWEEFDGLIGVSTWNQPEPNDGDPYMSIASVSRDGDLNHGRVHKVPTGTGQANGRLIKAAPDTLESLIEVLPIAEGLLIRDCSESGEDMSSEDAAKFERAHKAIAKAKGE